jgi:hypothetical protein
LRQGDRASGAEYQQHESRQPRRQRVGRERQRHDAQVGPEQSGRAADADHLEQKIDRKHDQAQRGDDQWNGDDHHGRGERPRDHRRNPSPRIERTSRVPTPEALFFPQLLPAVDGGEQGADDADATRADDVELNPRFVQRAQDAGVVRAIGAGARQHECGAALGRVRKGGGVGHPAASS